MRYDCNYVLKWFKGTECVSIIEAYTREQIKENFNKMRYSKEHTSCILYNVVNDRLELSMICDLTK